MKPNKRLVLWRERLTEIDGSELREVAGATHVGCVTHGYSCDYCDLSLALDRCVSQAISAVIDCVCGI